MKIYEVRIGDEYETFYLRYFLKKEKAEKVQKELIRDGFEEAEVNEVEVIE